MTLYELTGEYLELLALAEDPETDPQIFADTMEGLEGEIEQKADGYARVIRQLDADSTALKAEIDRLTARKKAIDNSIDRMKESLKNAMILTNKTKFKTELFAFGVRNNPPKLVIDHPDQIPASFLIPQEPKIDNAGIKDALKAGDIIAETFAHLEQTQSVSIR